MAKVAKNILIDDALPSNSADTDFFFNTSENIIYYRDRANYQWVPASSAEPGPQGPIGPQGPAGNDGVSLIIKGHKATSAQLPNTGNSYNDAWIVDNTGYLYIWQGSSWFNAGKIVGFDGAPGATGPQGPQGPAGPAGQDADATAAIAAHAALITGTHGVVGNIVGTNDIQTLTNKTISGSLNTLSNIPVAAITGLDSALTSYSSKYFILNQQTDSYTLIIDDNGKLVEINSATGKILSIPSNDSVAYPIGTQIQILQTGTGQITIAATAGVTLNGTPGLKLRAQWSSATLIKRATDTWVAIGDLSA
jgi:hypothetical protein